MVINEVESEDETSNSCDNQKTENDPRKDSGKTVTGSLNSGSSNKFKDLRRKISIKNQTMKVKGLAE